MAGDEGDEKRRSEDQTVVISKEPGSGRQQSCRNDQSNGPTVDVPPTPHQSEPVEEHLVVIVLARGHPQRQRHGEEANGQRLRRLDHQEKCQHDSERDGSTVEHGLPKQAPTRQSLHRCRRV